MVNDDGELATMRGGYTVIPGGGKGVMFPWDYRESLVMMKSSTSVHCIY